MPVVQGCEELVRGKVRGCQGREGRPREWLGERKSVAVFRVGRVGWWEREGGGGGGGHGPRVVGGVRPRQAMARRWGRGTEEEVAHWNWGINRSELYSPWKSNWCLFHCLYNNTTASWQDPLSSCCNV